jgi:hypothetical protein
MSGGALLWQLRDEASAKIGMGFRALYGVRGEIVSFDVGDSARGSVLLVGGLPVGGWIVGSPDSGCIPGVFALTASPSDVRDCR